MAKRKRTAAAKAERSQVEICQECEAACCRYITIFIPQPTDKEDFDNIRWYLCHEGVSVFQDDELDWAVIIPTDCKMLNRDHTCKIYEDRPEACRDYSAEGCENQDDSEGNYKEYFESVDELEAYLDRRWRRNRGAKKRRKRSRAKRAR